MQKTCVVVSPNQFFRDGVRQALRNTAFDIVADAATAPQIVSVTRSGVDLLIWSPGVSDDLEAEAGELRIHFTSGPPTRFVVLTDTDDIPLVGRVAALGVDAILSHSMAAEVFAPTLDVIMLGQPVFPPTVVQAASFQAAAGSGIAEEKLGAAGLTGREAQILGFLVGGASNKVIARELCVTEPTVKAHVKGLFRKIGVNNRTQAAVWAARPFP